MNYRILKKFGKNDYLPVDDRISIVDMLWLLLNELPPFFKEWIFDSSRRALSTNNCCLRKEGDKIVINFLYSDVDCEDDTDVISVTNQQLCHLIDQWDKLCEVDVEKIIIWSIDGDFTISEYLEQERSL